MNRSGVTFVVGRSEKQGELQDVKIRTQATGLNSIDIARDAKILDRRIYVVDRRVLPNGSWKRLLEVESFNVDASPEKLSEVKATVEFEEIANFWGIPFQRCWGLPEGMEAPWNDPMEMVGNELILPEDVRWVSGDAPVNINRNNYYQNGKYTVNITRDFIEIGDTRGEVIGGINTSTSNISWTEGVAGAAFFDGGSIYIEPGKPPLFVGNFTLDEEPTYRKAGLYEYSRNFLVSSVEIKGRSGVGAIAFVKDPFPERWVPRMMGRAYVKLDSPVYVPPLVEDEPNRISVSVHHPPTDFSDIKPTVITPYANKTGVFNAWTPESGEVKYAPLERPYDVFLPFDKIEDWGGHSVWTPGDYYPALDWHNQESAAFPNGLGYDMPELPVIAEGTIFYRWKNSGYFNVIKNDDLDVVYKEGIVYFFSKTTPSAGGIGKIVVSSGWNNTKIEFGQDRLFINDQPGLIEEQLWDNTNEFRWGQIMDIPESQWIKKHQDFPITEERFEEIPPTWETGFPEEEVDTPDPDYSLRPNTWGQVLYEEFSQNLESVGVYDEKTGIHEILEKGVGEV